MFKLIYNKNNNKKYIAISTKEIKNNKEDIVLIFRIKEIKNKFKIKEVVKKSDLDRFIKSKINFWIDNGFNLCISKKAIKDLKKCIAIYALREGCNSEELKRK